MAFFPFENKEMYYADIGEGRPILLLHGITNSGRAWRDQIPFLKDAGFRVIVPDLPGHGSSSPISRAMSPADYAEIIIALVKHLNLTQVACCGLSLGGAVTLEAGLKEPDLFGPLIIANSFIQTNSDATTQMAQKWKETFRKPHGPVLRLEETWPILVSQRYRDSAAGLSTFLTWHAQAALADAESYCHAADGLAQYDARDRAGQIRQRTLILSSADDKIAPMASSEALHAAIPGSLHVTIEGSEHISNVDRPDDFNQALLAFLEPARPS